MTLIRAKRLHMSSPMRWNVTKEAKRFAHADAIVVSIPKSGRTWLRVFLFSYFSELAGRPFSLANVNDGIAPNVFFTHDRWRHLKQANLKDRWRGKYLIPRRESREKLIILLARDPRDVVVSLYFQLTKRDNEYQGTLAEMIKHPVLGIDSIIAVMNAWIDEWGARDSVKLVRYEDCHRDPEAIFRKLLTFLGFRCINEAIFRRSVAFCSFENMQQMEASGTFSAGIISARDVNDPESFKTRRGLVGGYTDYVDAENMAYLDRAVTRLDRRYGYT